ncbi:MAG TPA: carboxypeptidase-like regulatory domain-containing protein [Acidobacteriaceae bacterium]|nr:carboxypeptidase-like regulatory domain-containing protein [Acidobacteriaceae bacterium]
MNRTDAGISGRTRVLTIAVLFLVVACLARISGTTNSVAAQTAQRSVQGRVVNQNDVPIRSAIVYLSDQHTLAVESYITQEDGAYRFEQLSPNDDYKLWAKVDGKTSKPKILSSFDDRAVFRVIIRIDTAK